MKRTLCLFLIIFLIWCLFNECTMWVLQKLHYLSADAWYSPDYFFSAFMFSCVAAILRGYFRWLLVFILLAEFCWLIILAIQGIEHNPGFIPLAMFNGNFFILDWYLLKAGAYWFGYYSGRLGLTLGISFIVGEMILIGLSVILAWAIQKLSIWLTERWIGKEEPCSIYIVRG